MDDTDLKALAANAKRAAVMAMVCVLVAIAVLVIDNGIKRDVLKAAMEARKILDEFKAVAHGAEKAGKAGGSGGGSVDADGGVVRDPEPGADVVAPVNGRARSQARRSPGVA